MKFVGLPLAVHEPVQVLALGVAAEAESADPLVPSVGVQVELAAAEAFAAHEAYDVLEAFCVPEVSVVPELFAVPEASAALGPFVVPAAVAKVAPAAVGVGGVPVVVLSAAAAAPVAIARCIEPAASTADLEMAAEPGMWRVADVQQLVAEVDAAAAHIAELHEPERRAVEPHSSPLKDPESYWLDVGQARTLSPVAVLGLSLKMTYY